MRSQICNLSTALLPLCPDQMSCQASPPCQTWFFLCSTKHMRVCQTERITSDSCVNGWVRTPRAKGGPFRPNLNIQPIKKINGGPPQPPNHDWKRFNWIWAFVEWLEHEILRFWKNARVPFFKNPQKHGVWKNPDLGATPKIQISTFSHPWNYLTYMERWISKS